MPLTRHEKKWISAYRRALKKTHPRAVVRLSLYGSKARGDDHAESDLDILLVIANKAAPLKRKLRDIGYLLAATGELVPSIMAYTEAEWERLKVIGSPFRSAIERDEVGLL